MFWVQGLNPLPGLACWWPWGTSSSPVPLSPQAQRHISDLYEDLRDGHNLISLLEVLSGDSLVRVPTHPPPLGPCLPFTWIPLPAFLSWGLSYTPTPRPAWPKPLPCLPAWSVGPSLGVAPSPRAAGSWPCCSLCQSPDTVTSRSALLWFLCCLDCELWPLPFTLCPALAGQPRERDVIRSSRLVSDCACWLRQRMASPSLGAWLTWGWWPVWTDLCLVLGQADGCACSCLLFCLLQCPGLGLARPRAATAVQEDPSPSATALHPRLPGYCSLPPLPSFPQPGPGYWTSKALAGPGPWASKPPLF